ncbi:hypothetical protein K504DRAFT_252034 [Pleomassaria siparia CBS 279.74]|uniref:Uncharacterized protein n=1 Tax=Pleomassaria siparia CBS 279.74 TaxID=1314801 RepID=A0A6G1KCC7_9PLEO|nr:hypothetical protein K504DRAFT_252034 [Pleomassaria siparia CBS 279.74]
MRCKASVCSVPRLLHGQYTLHTCTLYTVHCTLYTAQILQRHALATVSSAFMFRSRCKTPFWELDLRFQVHNSPDPPPPPPPPTGRLPVAITLYGVHSRAMTRWKTNETFVRRLAGILWSVNYHAMAAHVVFQARPSNDSSTP